MKSNIKRLILVWTTSFAGLVQVANAFYDPGLQRWINRDPLGEAGFETTRQKRARIIGDGPNLYSFAHNSPANSKDSFGLKLTVDDCNKFRAQALLGIKEQLAQDAKTGTIKGALVLAGGLGAAATGGVGPIIGVAIGGVGGVSEGLGVADTISDLREKTKNIERLYQRCLKTALGDKEN
jgi:RHS repeat-associated protein